MYILGISAFYHDSAAAILKDGEIIAAAQEERFSRKKHDAGFPSKAVVYCLKEAGVTIDQLEAVVFYDKPLLKFERLLETYYAFAPKGFTSFLMAMPVWLNEKLFLKKMIRDELKKLQPYDKKKLKLLFPEHHLSHAASAFYPSPFEEAAIVTIDGVGEWATTTICKGNGKNIEILKQLNFPHSVGLLYSAFTYYLGFKVNSGEYKLMGLAPYGDPSAEQTKQFVSTIKEKLITIYDDGSIYLDQQYFNYAVGLRMVKDKKFETLFGFKRRGEEEELTQQHCSLALAIQQVTEEIVLKLAAHAKAITGSKNICLSGGVALNCVANGKLQNANLFENMFIQPASGDAGGAAGSALAAHHIYFEKERIVSSAMDAMKGSYLGPSFSTGEIESTIQQYKAVATAFNNRDELNKTVATHISNGNVIGWFQGRMEFGPRALGNRSIIADPRNPEMQKKLNLKIKYREGFRPFAPAALSEDVQDYFELTTTSPYMLLVQPVKKNLQHPVPANYHQLNLTDKLYFQRSSLPAVTHIDYSARVQTVHKETNPAFHSLITAFKQQTGCAVLINTSFNVRGEPVVCTPQEAYQCFMRTEMDYLVIENYLFSKSDQPAWKEKEDWKKTLKAD
ncbi:carbamoyltransferase [Lacibacter cauensis]|uniref:Carbamoyltransferase n=1 Tax=Lacibacter cauensis TaxID=510947 RepID=A0A562SQH2_9BACT|nr:carbamoyltransferase [Lacibacter cauensis]TWI83509.1 carbamoyltransferase [Lacibacter cauensis]